VRAFWLDVAGWPKDGPPCLVSQERCSFAQCLGQPPAAIPTARGPPAVWPSWPELIRPPGSIRSCPNRFKAASQGEANLWECIAVAGVRLGIRAASGLEGFRGGREPLCLLEGLRRGRQTWGSASRRQAYGGTPPAVERILLGFRRSFRWGAAQFRPMGLVNRDGEPLLQFLESGWCHLGSACDRRGRRSGQNSARQ